MQKFILTLLLTLLAAGCQTLGPAEEGSASVKAPEKTPALPFQAPAPTHAEFDGELLFDYLIREIGMRQGDFSAALQGYLQAAETTGDPYAAERATRLALHIKDLDAAIRGASLWARSAPNSIDARKYFGALLLRKGRLDDAFAQFDAMRQVADAEGKDGLLLVAAVLAGEPGKAGARAMFERLVSDAPDAPESRYARALLNSAQGRYAEAEQDLVKALETRPKWPQARLLLSQVLIASKQSDQALEVLRSGVELQPDNKLLRNRYARLLVAAHAYDEALAQFRALHRLDPEDLEVTYGFAMLATQQQAWDEARELWQQLRKQPKYAAEAIYFLAQVEEQAGHHELALSLYRSVNKGPLVVDATIRAALLLQQVTARDNIPVLSWALLGGKCRSCGWSIPIARSTCTSRRPSCCRRPRFPARRFWGCMQRPCGSTGATSSCYTTAASIMRSWAVTGKWRRISARCWPRIRRT